MNAPSFSVIVCSVDTWKFAQTSACYTRLFADVPFEIIGIHDALSLAEGYNRGLRQCRGDIVVFSHDDILILDPDFARKIRIRLQKFDILGFAGTRRLESEYWWQAGLPWISGAVANPCGPNIHLSVWNTDPWPVVDDIQAIDGLCILARRETARQIGFDETIFDGFHLYDLDFSFSAWRVGKRLGVCCDIPVFHASYGNFDEVYQEYGRRFLAKHRDALSLSPSPVAEAKGRSAQFPDFRATIASWRREIFQRGGIARGTLA
ncbi:MAG: glycosyltransferase family protein [Azoarcus sp.]|jgi:glycosyltransferase involved in cell wall biosynthesis|nr:glycosyltransferase family protein [Azoarcus sp.]